MIPKTAAAGVVACLLIDGVESVPQQFSATSEVGAHKIRKGSDRVSCGRGARRVDRDTSPLARCLTRKGGRGSKAISFAQLCENRKAHSHFFVTFPNVPMLADMHRVVLNQMFMSIRSL